MLREGEKMVTERLQFLWSQHKIEGKERDEGTISCFCTKERDGPEAVPRGILCGAAGQYARKLGKGTG